MDLGEPQEIVEIPRPEHVPDTVPVETPQKEDVPA